MNKPDRNFWHRFFCAVSLAIGLYLIIDLMVSKTLNVQVILIFILLVAGLLWGMLTQRFNDDIIRKQEKELKVYQLYIRPLEELVREIRARQHEFDNHINAILNMHLTVNGYDELVEKQSAYIREVRQDRSGKYISLLRISDKVLAGFLYSKIVNAPENIETDVEVQNWEIISRVSEHSLIEIVGVLVDNAYEACQEQGGKVKIFLDSREDKMVFEILNQYRKLSLEEIGLFFKDGYSTKGESGRRGIGLGRAKVLTERAGGELTVGQEEIEGENYIHFSVVI